jgi:transcriptional regulator with XRE-family HTH domain
MLSEKLSNRMAELGWNVKVTAERTGLHRDLVSRLLHGSTKNPRIETVMKLCKGLKMSMDQLTDNLNDEN